MVEHPVLDPRTDPDVDDGVAVGRVVRGFQITVGLLLTSLCLACLVHVGEAGRARFLAGYRTLWPQDWSFFTPVDQDVLVLHRVDGSGRAVPAHERGFTDDRLGGVSRVPDARAGELRRIALAVPDGYWRDCTAEGEDGCADWSGRPVFRTANPAVDPLLCGHFVIALERFGGPVAGRLDPTPRHPHRAAAVEVRCPR